MAKTKERPSYFFWSSQETASAMASTILLTNSFERKFPGVQSNLSFLFLNTFFHPFSSPCIFLLSVCAVTYKHSPTRHHFRSHFLFCRQWLKAYRCVCVCVALLGVLPTRQLGIRCQQFFSSPHIVFHGEMIHNRNGYPFIRREVLAFKGLDKLLISTNRIWWFYFISIPRRQGALHRRGSILLTRSWVTLHPIVWRTMSGNGSKVSGYDV